MIIKSLISSQLIFLFCFHPYNLYYNRVLDNVDRLWFLTISMPFWRLSCEWGKTMYKSLKFILWFGIEHDSWYYVFMIFSSPDFWLINEKKMVVWKAICQGNVQFNHSQSNPYILPWEFDCKVQCEISQPSF